MKNMTSSQQPKTTNTNTTGSTTHEKMAPPTTRSPWTKEAILGLTQIEVDTLYLNSEMGSIPDGFYHGSVFWASGPTQDRTISPWLWRTLQCCSLGLTPLFEAMWKGKCFYRNEGLLRNAINWRSQIPRVIVRACGVSAKEILPFKLDSSKPIWQLFPAKTYSGHSLLDPNGTSYIIDYEEGASLPHYLHKIDRLAGKEGLHVRDEIRMVQPGLYLGRAYVRGTFTLNFLLQKL